MDPLTSFAATGSLNASMPGLCAFCKGLFGPENMELKSGPLSFD